MLTKNTGQKTKKLFFMALVLDEQQVIAAQAVLTVKGIKIFCMDWNEVFSLLMFTMRVCLCCTENTCNVVYKTASKDGYVLVTNEDPLGAEGNYCEILAIK